MDNRIKIYLIGKFKIVQVREKGKTRCLAPGSDISTESTEVQDACNEAWTLEIIQAYADHKAAQV